MPIDVAGKYQMNPAMAKKPAAPMDPMSPTPEASVTCTKTPTGFEMKAGDTSTPCATAEELGDAVTAHFGGTDDDTDTDMAAM